MSDKIAVAILRNQGLVLKIIETWEMTASEMLRQQCIAYSAVMLTPWWIMAGKPGKLEL